MNWIEIDRILYGIIARHDAVEDMLKEAEKHFKWNRSQSEAAIKPLLKRNNFQQVVVEKPKKASRQLTKRK
jgi:hypothetical protein